MKDSYHAWLSPVKAWSDTLQILQLVAQGIIDEHFVQRVLTVDMANPQFSKQRCELLRQIPLTASSGWQQQFLSQIPQVISDAPAFISKCQTQLMMTDITFFVKLLAQRRIEVSDSEISKNPRGQILEPGFRNIFPRLRNPASPETISLNADGMPLS